MHGLANPNPNPNPNPDPNPKPKPKPNPKPNPNQVLLLISMVPAVELRGGVPVGNWLGLSPLTTLVICVAGNMLPILTVTVTVTRTRTRTLTLTLTLTRQHAAHPAHAARAPLRRGQEGEG